MCTYMCVGAVKVCIENYRREGDRGRTGRDDQRG